VLFINKWQHEFAKIFNEFYLIAPNIENINMLKAQLSVLINEGLAHFH